MNIRMLLVGIMTLGAASLAQAQPVDAGSVRSAFDALPARYQSGVVKVSADDGRPNPPAWYILAKDAERDGLIYSLTIVQGQITAEKPSLDLRELLTAPTSIDLGKVAVGSEGAWNAAQDYVAGKNRRLGTVSYVLEQTGSDATPVWSVWCYSPDGSYIGMLKLLATTGDVISSE